MKKLEELTVYELAVLSECELEKLVEVEAMLGGVSKPEKDPPVADVRPVPAIKSQGRNMVAIAFPTAYGDPDIIPWAFDAQDDESVAAVQQIIELIIRHAIGAYRAPSTYRRAEYDPSVVPQPHRIACVAHTPAELRKWDTTIQFNNEAKTAHERELAEWNHEVREWSKVSERVHNAYWKARSERDSAASIKKKLDRFTELAGGDESVAVRFLSERYDEDIIANARLWWEKDQADG